MKQRIGKAFGSRAAVALLLVLSVGSVGVEYWCGLDLTSGIQVLLTGVLVWVTWSYTRATIDLADSARGQLTVAAAQADEAARQVREAPVRQLWELSFRVAETMGSINARLDLAAKGEWVGLHILAEKHHELAEHVRILTRHKHEVYSLAPTCPMAISALIHKFVADSTTLEAVALRLALAAQRLPDPRDVDAAPPTLDDLRVAWEALEAMVPRDLVWDSYCDGTYISNAEASLKDLRQEAARALTALT